MIHAIALFLGLTNASGGWYLWHSGFESNLPLYLGLFLIWRKVNCHAKGCPRIGLHKVDGTHYVTCRMHHPAHDGSKPATAEQISQAHAESSYQ